MSLTILVTGVSAGFGQAMARRFVRDGHRVIACARRADRLAKLAEELGPSLHPFTLDVTHAHATGALPGSLPHGWREVDVLVNNAGLARGVEPAQTASLHGWDEMVATNIAGLIHVTRALLPGMVERNKGHVINLGSTAGSYPYPGGNVYGATKAFVRQFTLNLKADLVGTNVRVTDIAPGLVGGSEFSAIRFGGDQSKADAVYAGTTPLNPDDIAEAAAWVIGLPEHMNVNSMELMPTCQGLRSACDQAPDVRMAASQGGVRSSTPPCDGPLRGQALQDSSHLEPSA